MSEADSLEQLRKVLKGIRVAMMTTVDSDGGLRSRPMATQELDKDGSLWFLTQATSPKTGEVERDHHVNLSYVSTEDNRYVSVSGQATVTRDRAKAEEIWNPLYKAWFPEGLDDPNLAVLRVSVEKAEYWDSPTSAVVHLAGFVKALATGKQYRPGENEKLDLDK